MVEAIFSVFGSYTLFIVPIIAAILTALVAEAINKLTPPTIKPIYILLFSSILCSVCLWLMFINYFKSAGEIFFILLLSIALSILFYVFGGAKFVEVIITKLQVTTENKITNATESISFQNNSPKGEDNANNT